MSDHYDRYNGMDAISRQAAIDICDHAIDSFKGQFGAGVLVAIKESIEELPPAEPKRGKWIYHIDDLFPAESTMECNQCHAEQTLICDDEFCPKCGAKMEVTT